MINAFYSGVWMDPFQLARPDDLRAAAQITKLGLNLANIPNVTCFDSCEEILEAAVFAEATHCVITSAGAWVDWDWKIKTNRWLASQPQDSWLVAGHILDFNARGGWYWLHPQFFIVDVVAWHRLGRPSFGTFVKRGTDAVILPACRRSDDNVHDDYTPRWLRPDHGTVSIDANLHPGWNMIVSSLIAGLPVQNIPDEIRRLKGNTYPENPRWPNFLGQITRSMTDSNPPVDDPELLDSSQYRYAKDLHERTWSGPNAVFVANNEGIDDVRSLPKMPVDHLICVAAGFKSNAILQHCGFHPGTKITFVDHSAKTLDFKRYLQESWDGEDLAAIWEAWSTDKAHLNGAGFDFNAHLSALREQLDLTSEQWREHWTRYRQLDIQYVKLDLIQEFDSLLSIMEQSQGRHAVLWCSNALTTWPSMIRLDLMRQLGREDWQFRLEHSLRKLTKVKQQTISSLAFRPGDVQIFDGQPDRLDQLSAALRPADGWDYKTHCRNAVLQAEQLHGDNPVQAGRVIHNSGLPWLRLDWQIPHQEMLAEAQALHDYFTEHRMHQAHRGWKSLGIHGLRAALTQGYEVYGYADDKAAPYDWTWVGKRCPVTTAWLKSLREYGRWHRVRFMLLEPLGYINLHQDRKTHALGPVNVALNMPQGCQFTMEGYGAVPFEAGDAYAVDIGNVHTVVNQSLERRYHMILHGEYTEKFTELLYRSAKLQC